jgi:ANTAR domain/GAF domain
MSSMRARFLAALAAHPDEALSPQELCAVCVEQLAVDRAAITISVGATSWEPLGASDEAAARIEAGQATVGEGPAVDALRRGGPVLVEDLSVQSARWPGLSALLGQDGRGAMFAFPLQLGAITLGVLDLYRLRPALAEPEEVAAMLAVADIVTMVLLSRPRRADAAGVDTDDPDAGWVPSLSSREIHQATGMVVAQLAVPADEAYLRLRAHAFAEGLPLIVVARDVIARRLRLDPGDEQRH